MKIASLYVVGMPIGNSADISVRALSILQSVKYIYTEDTRSFHNFLTVLERDNKTIHFTNKDIKSCFGENQYMRAKEICELVLGGENVCLLSEAGMPLVSDPGAYVVEYCRRKGVSIQVIPGPSALTTVMALSGFEPKSTIFLGYVPKKKSVFAEIAKVPIPALSYPLCVVFFESSHRIIKTLVELTKLDARICIARNMTKQDEQVWVGVASEIDVSLFPEKGEYTCALLVQKSNAI
ncbi:MAG: rRNA small subunit methyltransferase 1 [Candidatus Roizmanbacteria bacterium]|nr:rRNA small subunit methyltransferase 1 [Candidatus Roizmanbacteria bacterium]